MRRISAAILTLALSASSLFSADKYYVYFGCYTGKGEKDSKGISRSEFNTKTGELSTPVTVAEMQNPSFLAIHPSKKAMFAVGEVWDESDKKTAGINGLSLNAKTGELKVQNGLSSGGSGPCHVSIAPDGKTAVVANYGGGSCAFYKIDDDAKLTRQIAFFQHEGKLGPNKQRQDKAHGHCGMFDPEGKFAYVCDLGLDVVRVYEVNGETIKAAGEIVLPPGSGPRHIAISPKGDFAFVNGELDATVNLVSLKDRKVLQSISTLPGGKNVAGNTTAEVVFHPSGKFVYCSNRGHNSIAAFSWDGSKLTAIGEVKDGINVPRNFNIDPSGEWMIVANQNAGDACVFKIGKDGVPVATGNKVKVGGPVCVKFLAIE